MNKSLKTLIAAMTIAALQFSAGQAAAQTSFPDGKDGDQIRSQPLAALEIAPIGGLRGGDYGV